MAENIVQRIDGSMVVGMIVPRSGQHLLSQLEEDAAVFLVLLVLAATETALRGGSLQGVIPASTVVVIAARWF